jgi:hypothetical protein
MGIKTGSSLGGIFAGMAKGLASALVDGVIWATPYLITFALDIAKAFGVALHHAIRDNLTFPKITELAKDMFFASDESKSETDRMISSVLRPIGKMSPSEVGSFGDGKSPININMDLQFNGPITESPRKIASSIRSAVDFALPASQNR